MKKLAFIMLLPFLGACSTVVDLATKTAEVWMEPSIPVGEPEDRLSTVALSMNATPQVNPNIYNDNILAGEAEKQARSLKAEESAVVQTSTDELQPEATPISFKLIQLKDNALFLQADFEGLFDDLEKALSTTYLAHDDFMLIPGEFKFVEAFEVEDEARYVAVIAAYNDYANKQWKEIVKIKTKGKEYSLLLHFDEQKVVIKKQEL